MERQSHNNPWADRLQEVSIPEAGEAWQAMETILDKEMPGVGRIGKRVSGRIDKGISWARWLPFTLSTALLTAFVCYIWFGRHPHTALHQLTQSSPAAASGGRTAADSPSKPGPGPDLSPDDKTPLPDHKAPTAAVSHRTAGPASAASFGAASRPGSALRPGAALSMRPARHPLAHRANNRTASAAHPLLGASSTRVPSTRASSTRVPSTAALPTRRHGLYHSDPGKIRSLGIPPSIAIGRGMVLPKSKPEPIPSKQNIAARSRRKSPLSLKNMGWRLGVGFNQGVAVSGQQAWNHYNVGGLNNPLLDYIPVPTISYYFQPKLYVQAEARFHAPQYTQNNLGFQYTDNDSSGLLTGFVYIEKLFYLQLPVSIHYSPLPHWSVGLGLQYSRFEKGIAYSQYTGGSKPVSLGRYKSLSFDHNDFRGLVSLDYTFRNWVVGISYDQAFNHFIHTQTSSTVSFNSQTLARNSSLQISLRYTLWDSRRKRRSPAK